MKRLIAEGFSGGICKGIPRKSTRRNTVRFLIVGIPDGIFDRIPVVIYWTICLVISKWIPLVWQEKNPERIYLGIPEVIAGENLE